MVVNSPQQSPKLEVQLYEKPKDFRSLRQSNIPFSGAPHQHPSDPDRMMLVTDPYGGSNSYYEFQIRDVALVEELPNLVTFDGETITMARIWIRKSSVGVHCSPFVVEDIEKPQVQTDPNDMNSVEEPG
jgi:hypothetical protein